MFHDQKPVATKTMSFIYIFALVLIKVKSINGLDPVCVPGVSKYASSIGPGFYYECQPGDDSPVLNECPDGARWDRKSMLCREIPDLPIGRQIREAEKQSDDDGKDKPEIMFEPVLDRPVRLGDLYDARRDLPLSGFSLWNEHVIKESKLTENKLHSKTNFYFENSVKDKIHQLSIDASLSLSLFGGLITVTGSAHYLKDEKETKDIMRFNMDYKATTKTEMLPMSLRQNLTYPYICGKINKDSGPTHVISSVVYGMNAHFIFERIIDKLESKEEIAGSLSIIIKKIPTFKIEGNASVSVNASRDELGESLNVTMYGDFIVDSSPTTYEAAKQVYEDLPKYLGDEETGYKKSSPVNIMLTPIGEYCTDSQLKIAGISAELMSKAIEIMHELSEVMMNVRTLEATYLANKFLDVSALLKLFRIKLDVYTIETKTKLRHIIPAMRGGGGEEQLAVLLKNYSASPFQYDHGIRFLQERERELNTINSLFDDEIISYGHIQIGDFTSANIAHALLHKTYVFIYKFSVFSDIHVTEEYVNNKTIISDTWYNDYKLIGLAGYNWRQFKSFVKINKDSSQDQQFFIQGSPLGDKITQIFVYENGLELTADFKVPMPPPKPKVIAKSYNSVTLLIGNNQDTIKNEFVTEIVVKYGTELELKSNYREAIIKTNVNQLWTLGKQTNCWYSCGGKGGPCESFCGQGGYCCRKGFYDCPEMAQRIAPDFHSCIINPTNNSEQILWTIEIPFEQDKIPVTHTFITIFQTFFGRGRDSEPLMGVRPLASSAPKLESMDHVDSKSVKLKWHTPEIMPKHLILSGYKVNIINVRQFNTITQELTLTNLEPATKYTYSLEVWFHDWTIIGETSQADFYTIPSRPAKPSAVNIDKHDVSLQLDSRDELTIAPGSTFKQYRVMFYKVNDNMTAIPGTQYELDFENSKVEISSLVQGTKYNFEYKLVTSKGSSLFSPPLLIETKYNKTELEQINQEIVQKSSEIFNHMTEKLAPLGTIIAWIWNPTSNVPSDHSVSNLPRGWQRCDGSIIPRPSVWAGQRTPNLNGEKRFLRGGNDQEMLDLEEDTTKLPNHAHIDHGHKHTVNVGYGNDEIGEWYQFCIEPKYCKDFYRSRGPFPRYDKTGMGGVEDLGTYNKETRPKNMNVIYIMRIF